MAGDPTDQALTDFDSLWNYEAPARTEAAFRALLPAAEASGDAEHHIQLLTQIARAQGVITLQTKSPDSRQKATGALRRRDAWFVRNSHEALVIWDGEEEFVGKLVRSLQEGLGDDVWVLDPAEFA